MAYLNHTVGVIAVSDLLKMIKQRKDNILTVTNGNLIRLFWDIGTLLNKFLSNNKVAENNLFLQVSSIFEKKCGSWLEEENLKKMMKFATKFPELEKLIRITPFISWDHILLVLEIRQELAFTYLEYSVNNGLTVDDLNAFINSVKPGKTMKKGKIISQPPQIYNIFKGSSLGLIKNMMISSGREVTEIQTPGITNKINRLVEGFRNSENKWINQQVIFGFWEFGVYMNHKTDVAPKKDIFQELSKQMKASQLAVFNEREISFMAKFARLFPQFPLVIGISQLVGWGHIKVLLALNDINQIFFYAKMAAEKGFNPIQLKKEISAGSIKLSKKAASKKEAQYIKKLLQTEEENSSRRIGNKIISNTVIRVHTDDKFSSNLTVNNIFKAPYLNILTS